jgi:hypothetical protein
VATWRAAIAQQARIAFVGRLHALLNVQLDSGKAGAVSRKELALVRTGLSEDLRVADPGGGLRAAETAHGRRVFASRQHERSHR